MKKRSAGLLVYRNSGKGLEVFISHPGGPFFAGKDEGAWSIPKGLYEDGESSIAVAKREFEEEIGQKPPTGNYIDLGSIKRSDGKVIEAWAVAGDIDENSVISNTFELEWPPRTGRMQQFPEVDRAGWFDVESAAAKLQTAQIEFLKRLTRNLGDDFLG